MKNDKKGEYIKIFKGGFAKEYLIIINNLKIIEKKGENTYSFLRLLL